jgi:WD40 repeat protein
LSTPGGGDVALHDIVAISPATGKLYARMMPRDQYISYEPPGSLYELSTDGTNHYRKIFDFERPVSFVISQDGTKIAYIPNESINNHSVVVRALDSGDEISRLDLSEFNSYWISSISWASDSKTLLINLGDTPLTIKNTDTKTGCYLVDIYSKAMHKLVGPLFQTPTELASGYKTDPFGYSYLPNSNRLIGVARKYETGVSSPFVTLYSVDLEGTNLTELPLGFNEDVWRISLSPSGKYVAYQCQETMLCETNFQDNLSEIIAQPIQQKEEIDQQQTIIGWLEN